jgi:hypothetical protein
LDVSGGILCSGGGDICIFGILMIGTLLTSTLANEAFGGGVSTITTIDTINKSICITDPPFLDRFFLEFSFYPTACFSARGNMSLNPAVAL